jgi:hypothetical protein
VSGSTLWCHRLCFQSRWHKLGHTISDRLCADIACAFKNAAQHACLLLRLVSIAAGSKMHPACRSSIPGKFDATLRGFVWFAVCSICVDLNPWRGSTTQLLGTLVQAAGKWWHLRCSSLLMAEVQELLQKGLLFRQVAIQGHVKNIGSLTTAEALTAADGQSHTVVF